jgi:hypothetical protein
MYDWTIQPYRKLMSFFSFILNYTSSIPYRNLKMIITIFRFLDILLFNKNISSLIETNKIPKLFEFDPQLYLE